MITTSEYAVIIIIWVLTLAGAFFGGRAAWRRIRRRDIQKKGAGCVPRK